MEFLMSNLDEPWAIHHSLGTELPPYADALRHETGLPVFDAITNAEAGHFLERQKADFTGILGDFHVGTL